MGTDCQIRVTRGKAQAAILAVDTAWRLLVGLDLRWSRFRPDSELSWFNSQASAVVDDGPIWIQVSNEMAALLSAMIWAHSYSEGWVDAALLPEVIAAGYDKDFELVRADTAQRDPEVVVGGARWSKLEHMAVRDTTCEIDAPVTVDSGGVGKGLAADLLAQVLMGQGARGAVVNLGGDIRAIGCDHDGRPWRIVVSDPTEAALLADWSVSDAGVATSSTAIRRWVGGHHLIDPHTGRPSTTDAATVSVVDSDALGAEVAAKTALLMGVTAGAKWLSERKLSAVMVTAGGQVIRVVSN
jgi:thiamine biosynthesis lipoprotein